MSRTIIVIGALSHALKCRSEPFEKGFAMSPGHELRSDVRSKIDVVVRETDLDGTEERSGSSTTFIITAENMAELAARDPEKARLEIVLKLHKTCSARVYGFLRKSVSSDIADDLTQETFLKLLQVKNIERKSISISYLFRIAQNLLRRRFNVMKRRREIMEKIARSETPAQERRRPEPVGIEAMMLDSALEGLDLHEQETIRLIICDGLSYTQAARALDVPVSTINNWKHRALQKLRGTIDATDSRDSQSFSTKRSSDHAGGRGQQVSCSAEPSSHLEGVSAGSKVSSEVRKDRIRVAG